MQVSSSGALYNGTGSLISSVQVTASIATTALTIPTSAPISPMTGSIYFNTSSNKLFIYTGTAYKTASLG